MRRYKRAENNTFIMHTFLLMHYKQICVLYASIACSSLVATNRKVCSSNAQLRLDKCSIDLHMGMHSEVQIVVSLFHPAPKHFFLLLGYTYLVRNQSATAIIPSVMKYATNDETFIPFRNITKEPHRDYRDKERDKDREDRFSRSCKLAISLSY